MEVAIDANAPLDYMEFDIFPSQNRYEACVCCANKKERVTSGLLEPLLLHSAEIRALQSNGSDAKYRLSCSETANDNQWFTKSTLIRFLHIIGSANILEVTDSLKHEICQLEESRKFHLSLYTDAEGADASKNELLRAIDSRLTALGGELTAAFDQAAGSRYSIAEMVDVEEFSQHIGSESFSESLRKCIELRLGTHPSVLKEGNNRTGELLLSETPVRYGVSPAKLAQIERAESDESSFSSEEEQPSAERSRTLARSASPRRSASPMRRVQIGRSGSRRATAITIKSLNFIPARERSFFPKDPDASDSDEEGSHRAPKQSENNVRISVQDAINLFESKQRDQKTSDVQKTKSTSHAASIGPSKSVLRRWSSGTGENSSRCLPDDSAEDYMEAECQPDVVLEECPVQPHGLDAKLNSPEELKFSPLIVQEETLPTESTDVNEKLIASAEWSRQKEAELSELLKKMMETKSVRSPTVAPSGNKRQSLPSEKRGISYNQYKEKRDERLRGEAARKGTEKDKQFKPVQKVLDVKKSQAASEKLNDTGKKQSVKRMQKPQKSVAEPANVKTESPKLSVVKKAPPKSASLPATRKSWPSMSSARAPGTLPAKTPPGMSQTGSIPARRRSQPAQQVSRSNTKVEKSLPVKSKVQDSKSSLGSATEKKRQPATKPGKSSVKSKVHVGHEELASAEKMGLNSKVAKKNSVVPLESKPFLRKGSGTISNINPTAKKKLSSPQVPLKKSEDLSKSMENVNVVSNSSDLVILNEERVGEACIGKEYEAMVRSPQNPEGEEKCIQVDSPNDATIDRVVEPEPKGEDDVESSISPTAWVEIEEHDDQPATSRDHDCLTVGSLAYPAPVGVSGLRVRHSLSQMLLEESSEPDVVDWGNAENPPQMAYHKDAPRGLKRLLKFARKSKTDASSVGWSSPSVFSEGEDDTEDSKLAHKRSTENLLRKAALHSKNNGHQKYSTDYEHSAQGSVGNFDVQSLSQQMHDSHVSASVITTKASRSSFFSLSAFKGSK